jgi:multicomponent Na+:H+ antiporter subunit F
MLCLAAFLALIRLSWGPSVPDRVVALDLFSMIFVGAMVVGSIFYRQEVFLNAAVMLVLVVFIGTIAFARFLERRVNK